jgi:hypothetical protein
MEMVLLLHLIKPRTSKQLLGNKSNYLHHPLIPSVLQGQLRKMNLLIVQAKILPIQHYQHQLQVHNMVQNYIKQMMNKSSLHQVKILFVLYSQLSLLMNKQKKTLLLLQQIKPAHWKK